MERLLILALVGFVAQLVDGALGMAYGLTSTTLLLLWGMAPAVASASVHLAEVVTTIASGIAHVRFGNVDRETVWRLMIPGSVGAFVGACFLSLLPGEVMKPFISAFLLLLGFYILIRFLFTIRPRWAAKRQGRWSLSVLGLVAGFFDASGGGGWGPITTPVLLSRQHLEPRKVIGSVDTSEFAVALSASVGFLIALGFQSIQWIWVGAFVLGGVAAAPLAAWLIRIIPAHILGILVGGLILLTNTRILLEEFTITPPLQWATLSSILLLWLISLVYAIGRKKE